MPNTPTAEPAIPPLPPLPPLISVPALWPMVMWAGLAKEGPEALAKNLKFAEEEIKIHAELRPKLATPNVVRLDLRTMVLRDYGVEPSCARLLKHRRRMARDEALLVGRDNPDGNR